MSERFLGFVSDRIKASDVNKGDNALIKIVAKRNEENGSYEKLSASDAKQFCPPEGFVFAPGYYAEFNSPFNAMQFVEFAIKKGLEKETRVFNQTDFIIDYDFRPKGVNLIQMVPYNGKVPKIIANKYISPAELNNTLDKENLFEKINTNFLLYDENTNDAIGIFKYTAATDTIESNYGKEVQHFFIPSENMVFNKNKRYALINLKGNTLERKSMIDFMTDQQLADWFSKKFSNSIGVNKQAISSICSFPEAQSQEDDLDLTRLERIKSKADAIELDIQNLVELVCTHKGYFSQFVDNIDIIEKEVEERINKELLENASDEILNNKSILENQKKQQDELQKKINSLKAEYKEKSDAVNERIKKETANLEKELAEKQKQLDILNNNYDTVLATLSVALPSLNTAQVNHTSKIEKDEDATNKIIPAYFPDEGVCFTELQEKTEESAKSVLLRNLGVLEDSPLALVTSARHYLNFKACFVPCVAWGFLFAKAVRNAEVYTIHVEHDWLHYEDFCNHGLLVPFKEADKNPEKNYILILDGLNITQPECGLRPLLNLINGCEPVLQGYAIPFPSNLTIFATLLPSSGENSLGLKLNPAYFKNWGTLGNPSNIDDIATLPVDFDIDPVTENPCYFKSSELKSDRPRLADTNELRAYFEY